MWTSSGRFNPRSPCGERRKLFIVLGRHIDFNPRSPCGERRELFPRPFCQAGISIHAPRVGSDTGGDNNVDFERAFQSTLPVRGATRGHAASMTLTIYFNPRSPCGERRLGRRLCMAIGKISIHAPRAGSDIVLLYQYVRG